MTSFFQNVPQAPPDTIFGLAEAFHADSRPQKIDLVVGVYKDEQLKCDLLPSVRRAKEEILDEDGANYLPIDGSRKFCEEIGKLFFGEGLWKEAEGRIVSAQSVGGTGALRVLGDFLVQQVTKRIAIPVPTWANHRAIFEQSGFVVETFPYYANKAFNFSGVVSFLKKVPEKSAVLFHVACHNPTGCDPTYEEWMQLAHLMRERHLLPIFDCAYQGFGDGLEKDTEAVRCFLKEGIEFFVAYSCSKNFSLYCQRTGVLFAVCKSSSEKLLVGSQIRRIIRAIYSNPPAHGARIAAHILGGPLRKQWEGDVEAMRARLHHMRALLVQKLGGGYSYLLKQKGMFSLLDLEADQLQRLIKEYAIYMAQPGRISIAGLSESNIDRVVEGIRSISRA